MEVFLYEIFNFIKADSTVLEREPFQKLTKKKELMAYRHFGFWQCMDTLRDKNTLVNMIKNKKAPWITKKRQI